MELIEAKITALITLGFGSLIAGLLPLLFTRFTRRASPLRLSALLCFGAGVLLSTALVHMLPEIRADLGTDYEQYAELIVCAGFFVLYAVDEIVHLFYKEYDHRHGEDHFAPPQPNYGATETAPLINNSLADGNAAQPSQLCHIGHEEPCESSYTGTFSLLLALTIHSLLEGLAVGLEGTTEQVLMMLGAVASHKFVVGFCLGTELSLRNITHCQYFISIVLFSFGSSLGIGIGAKVADFPDVMPKLLMPILQGLAGGTLLYVTVAEVLPRERAQWHKKPVKLAGILQLLMTLVGFTGMTLMILYYPS